jgi:propionate catabolism operon transcriptional regulator
MERLALFLAAEPLQALSPGFIISVAPEFIQASIPMAASAPAAASTAPQAAESIMQVLARFDGNREAAARYLGISRTTLWRKIKSQ